ncbi:hypothetical protein F0P94_17755 [Adhaeribacter soli]|uniref:Uncharacterized protein n=1 Tax=Adhaeribacter soli TaxID=2607655 RepID=A0A5N1IIP0_9BACT|nr:hypothetical protein F0P94_17755 [Adhaeribacter soli]
MCQSSGSICGGLPVRLAKSCFTKFTSESAETLSGYLHGISCAFSSKAKKGRENSRKSIK